MSRCLPPTVPPTEQITNALDTSVPMERSSWFLSSLLLAGLVNALSAIPMSRFNSNKMFDLKDLKAENAMLSQKAEKLDEFAAECGEFAAAYAEFDQQYATK